jgi:hypothetical protein
MLVSQFSNTYNKDVSRDRKQDLALSLGFDLDKLDNKGFDTRKVLRNCVRPDIGKYVFDTVNNLC